MHCRPRRLRHSLPSDGAHRPARPSVTSTPNPSTSGTAGDHYRDGGPSGPPTPTEQSSFTSNGTAISGCTAVPLVVADGGLHDFGTGAGHRCHRGDLFRRLRIIPAAAARLSQIVNPVPSPVQFAALTPCRVVDTRNPNGPFGGPPIGGHSSRSFPLAQSGNPCGIPATAVAYSLNVTVVPGPSLGYLDHLAGRRRAAGGLDHELAGWARESQCRDHSRGDAVWIGERVRDRHGQCGARHRRLLHAQHRLDAAVLSADPVPRGGHAPCQRRLWAVRI